MSETETRAGLTDSDCDALDDVWSEETTVSATAFYPVVARIVERRMAPARAELARLRGVVEAVQALADEWERSSTRIQPWTAAAGLRAVLAPVSSSGEAESGEALAMLECVEPGCVAGFAWQEGEGLVDADREALKDRVGRLVDGFIRGWVSPGIQEHLLDDDDNAGERLREALVHVLAAEPLAARPVLSREAVRAALDGHWPELSEDHDDFEAPYIVCQCGWRYDFVRDGRGRVARWRDHLADVLDGGRP